MILGIPFCRRIDAVVLLLVICPFAGYWWAIAWPVEMTVPKVC